MPFGINVSLVSATDVSCKKEIFASLSGIAANIAAGALALAFGSTEKIIGADFFAACNFALAAVPSFLLTADGRFIFFCFPRFRPEKPNVYV